MIHFRPTLADDRLCRVLTAFLLALAMFAAEHACFAESPSTILVVAAEAFRDPMAPWTHHRTSQGYVVRWVDPRPTAVATTEAIRDASRGKADVESGESDADSVCAILLVGTAPPIGRSDDAEGLEVATHYQPTTITRQFGSTPTMATDAPYSDLDADGEADVPVGRLPARNPESLGVMIEKVLANDRGKDFGLWRRRVELVGGLGGFGPLIDTAIESVTRSIVTTSLPTDVCTGVLYASPGHPFMPSDSFGDAMRRRYADGCRFWVYAGHGLPEKLDDVPRASDVSDAGHPILTSANAVTLSHSNATPPIAVMLACFTAAFDIDRPSIAESMMAAPGGPSSVLAGTRVTMPYGNASWTLRLIDAVYDRRCETLGEAFFIAQQQLRDETHRLEGVTGSMVDGLAAMFASRRDAPMAERREHASLFQLLGDPTMSLHPPRTIPIKMPRGVDHETAVAIEMTSPLSGNMTLIFQTTPGHNPEEPNRVVVSSESFAVEAGRPIRRSMTPPPGHSGWLRVIAHVEGSDGWAVGGDQVNIRPAASPNAR